MSIEHYLPRHETPTICDVFKAASIDTWERIKFSRTTPGLKISETTITQNIVYELRLLKQRYMHVGYTLAESKHEDVNGRDMLLRILYPGGRVYTFALQAKIIYHDLGSKKLKTNLDDGNYQQLKHMVGKASPIPEPQVDKLLKYSKKRGYIPFYLLYNYVKKKYRGVNRQFGCTIVGAQHMKDKHTDPKDGDLLRTVRFSQLHLFPAFPLSDLICEALIFSEENIRDVAGLPPDYELTAGSRSDLRSDEDWFVLEDTRDGEMEFIAPGERTQKRNKEISDVGEDVEGYSPMFRLDVDLRQAGEDW